MDRILQLIAELEEEIDNLPRNSPEKLEAVTDLKLELAELKETAEEAKEVFEIS